MFSIFNIYIHTHYIIQVCLLCALNVKKTRRIIAFKCGRRIDSHLKTASFCIGQHTPKMSQSYCRRRWLLVIKLCYFILCNA